MLLAVMFDHVIQGPVNNIEIESLAKHGTKCVHFLSVKIKKKTTELYSLIFIVFSCRYYGVTLAMCETSHSSF